MKTALTGSVTTKNEKLFLPSRVTRYDSHINPGSDNYKRGIPTKGAGGEIFIEKLISLIKVDKI